MKIGYHPDGEPFVITYESGDLVTLLVDEPGPFGTGKAGDWGRVTAVDAAGCLTILLAGYSLPPSAALRSLSGLPARLVMACDARGRPRNPTRHPHRPLVDRHMR
jgi:hypothetical protein